MPKDFSFYPKRTQLWMLIPPQGEYAKNPWSSMVGVVGLLAPGVARASAEAELKALQARIINEAPSESILRTAEPDVLDLQSEFVWLTGRNLRVSLIVLFAAVTFVLLIACVNVATLFLSRASERQREFGVRAALGASRLRTTRQLLTESLLLSILGGLFGVLLATASIRYLNAKNPVDLPPGNPITINWQILAFTAFLAILSALIFGLAPARKASRFDLNAVLKKEGGKTHFAARYLVVGEVALSLVLLAGAGLMIESLDRLISTPLGFQPAHLLAANIDLTSKSYSTSEQRLNFYNTLKSVVLAIPGVQGVAFAPLVSSGSNAFSVERKRGVDQGALGNDVSEAAVDVDYFRVMEIPLLNGREFGAIDQQKTLPVAIVNEALANKYLHGDPVGQHIKLGKSEDKNPWLTVVGVVGNVKGFVVFKEMGYVTDPCVYLPLTQSADSRVAILARTAQDPTAVLPAIRDEFSHLDGSLPPLDLTTMNEWLSQSFTQPRLRADLLSIFAGLGLVLCGIGIFGVVSQSVAQRRHEIGVRMALGARQGDTLQLVLRQGMGLVAAGIVIGIAGALALMRVLSSLLYGVSAADPVTLAAVAILLMLVALAACYLPARRAMRVDPMVALRYE
jgi:putative ABC transport system permease protein